MSSGGGIIDETKMNCCNDKIKTIGSEMQRILRAAGIESATMDPSSAKCLRELIAVELEKQESNKDSHKVHIENKSDTVAPIVPDPDNTVSPIVPKTPKEASSSSSSSSSSAAYSGLSKTSSSVNSSLPTTESVLPAADNSTFTQADKRVTPCTSNTIPITSSLKFVSKMKELSSSDGMGASLIDSNNAKDDAESIPSASIRNLLESQQKTLEDQSKAIQLLTAHIQDLTDAVHTLQQSVKGLEGSQIPTRMQQQNTRSTSSLDQNSNESIPNEPTAARANNVPMENHFQPENPNEFQRAHMLAHHVAWRIATLPFRALFFYLKYEYRIWLVLYRLARRDVLNPFREAGMIFQLGFALIIVYGRIAPALENAVNERKRQQQGNDDDDDYYDEALLEDAEFQIQTLVTAILVGFLYHVGVFGLVYRFFFRDRLHIRIWKDLREGVELTETYGLDFDEQPDIDTDEDDNNHGRDNNDAMNNDDDVGQAGRNNNNNIPRPPNRNRNRDNANNDGPLFEMVTAIGNWINDFFMGHGQRRRAAQEQVNAEEHLDGVDLNRNHRNPIMGLLSDILCLFYSFFVSILPGWNYEQQLRDIRDEEDMRLRAIMEREAEALRNQHLDDNEETESEDEDLI